MALLLCIKIFTEFSQVTCFFFEWGGMGQTFVQTGMFDLLDMHTSRHDSVTLAYLSHMQIINENKLVVVCRHLRPIAD